MKDQTLQSIDDNVVSAAEFLGGFDEKKRACLRAYAESQGIIKWIKKETKGSICSLFNHSCTHSHSPPSPQMLKTCRTSPGSHWPQQLVERMPTHVTSYLI